MIVLLLVACDLSVIFGGTPDNCTTTYVDCPTGCVYDLPDGEVEVTAIQCGEQDGIDTCWEAEYDVVFGDAACAYADSYADPYTTSTCTSLSIEVCTMDTGY